MIISGASTMKLVYCGVLLCLALLPSPPILGAQQDHPEGILWEFRVAALFREARGSLLMITGTGWFEPSRRYAAGGGTTLSRNASGMLVSDRWTLLSVLETVPDPRDRESVRRLNLLLLLPAVHPAPLILEVHVRRTGPGGGPATFILGALDPGHGTFFLRAVTKGNVDSTLPGENHTVE
jgi:hypothetical protein